MKFRNRNLRAIAEMIIGDNDKFHYRSSSYITEFFEECDLDYVHDGSTRWSWTVDVIEELLKDPLDAPNTLPSRFVHVLRVLMLKADALEVDPDRAIAMEELNKPLSREGYEAFYGDDGLLLHQLRKSEYFSSSWWVAFSKSFSSLLRKPDLS